MTNPHIESVACPICGDFPPMVTITDRYIFACMSCEHVWTVLIDDSQQDGPASENESP